MPIPLHTMVTALVIGAGFYGFFFNLKQQLKQSYAHRAIMVIVAFLCVALFVPAGLLLRQQLAHNINPYPNFSTEEWQFFTLVTGAICYFFGALSGHGFGRLLAWQLGATPDSQDD